eukprot:TRINITY_DN6219_c0_g1_i1.p1 TRINITY_DN6219_c0_g1~~TRINITY_DN6219_c0_g1_i1.p1  ORF type:complete len:339 (+),score=-15.41 TRINITY_DN6219_c0_g1_i1:67-1083(+)
MYFSIFIFIILFFVSINCIKNSNMTSNIMRTIRIAKGKTTYPTGNKNFAVIQSFPAAITAEESDPFLMCDHFGPTVSTGKAKHPDEYPIGWHPHRGMDILTYLIEGVGRHADSMGNRGEYASPGMQWIRVGSGIEHAEGGGTPAGDTTQGFQIWVNVPSARKMDDPQYGVNPPETIPKLSNGNGMKARLLSGRMNDLQGPFNTVTDTQMIDYMLDPNFSHEHEVPNHLNNCLIYVYKGKGLINNQNVVKNDIVHLDATDQNHRKFTLQSDNNDELAVIMFAGKKLNEPIAWHGPFVMNTDAEIDQTISDYRRGKFLIKRAAWDYKRIDAFPSDHKFEL